MPFPPPLQTFGRLSLRVYRTHPSYSDNDKKWPRFLSENTRKWGHIVYDDNAMECRLKRYVNPLPSGVMAGNDYIAEYKDYVVRMKRLR